MSPNREERITKTIMAVPKLLIRKATSDDAPAILPLVRIAYRGRGGWTNESHLVADERIDLAGILEKVNEPDGAVLVAFQPADAKEQEDSLLSARPAEEEGRLIGCCELKKHTASAAYFGLFAVDPTLQGGGVGRRVLERAEAYARDTWETRELEMCVIWTRDDLIAWYMRRGYRKSGRTQPFPYENLYNGKALRDDLYFEVLTKEVVAAAGS